MKKKQKITSIKHKNRKQKLKYSAGVFGKLAHFPLISAQR